MHPTLARLDHLATSSAGNSEVRAVLGLGSAGLEHDRFDEHSDIDFFVIVDTTAAKQRYLADVDWLSPMGVVVYDFVNDPNGRKALFDDGLFVEYAIFTTEEARAIPFAVHVMWGTPVRPRPVGTPRVRLRPALRRPALGQTSVPVVSTVGSRLPLLPGILVAAVMSFLAAFDEAQGTYLVGAPTYFTMPTEMYTLVLNQMSSSDPSSTLTTVPSRSSRSSSSPLSGQPRKFVEGLVVVRPLDSVAEWPVMFVHGGRVVRAGRRGRWW